jgi:hypothetical protein
MTEDGLRSRSVAVKEKLSEEHRLYRLAFAEDKVDHYWGNVIFSDESVLSSANDGPVRVYRPQGTCYNAEYVKESARSGRVSVAGWGWISSRRIGLLHRWLPRRGPVSPHTERYHGPLSTRNVS